MSVKPLDLGQIARAMNDDGMMAAYCEEPVARPPSTWTRIGDALRCTERQEMVPPAPICLGDLALVALGCMAAAAVAVAPVVARTLGWLA